jgi:hypothetical protein
MSTLDREERRTIEEAILDALADADGRLHCGRSLTVRLYVVAGLCRQADTPVDIATEFAVKLRRIVAEAAAAEPERTLQ